MKRLDKTFKLQLQLLNDKEMCSEMGANGRKFAEEAFNQKIFIEKYMKNRMSLLGM